MELLLEHNQQLIKKLSKIDRLTRDFGDENRPAEDSER
jgi:hypothetical protein